MSNPPGPPDKNAGPAVAPRHGVPRTASTPNTSTPAGRLRSTHASFPSRGEEVTPPARLAPGARSNTTPTTVDALRSKLAEHPQLDERDSIFATTYSTRDSPEHSPRLSPLLERPAETGSPSQRPPDMAAIPAQRPNEPFPHRAGLEDVSGLHTPMPYPIGVHRHMDVPLDIIHVDPDQPSPRQYIAASGRSHTIHPFDAHGLDQSSSSSTRTPTAHSVANSSHGQASPVLGQTYEQERQLYRSWREGKPALAKGRTSQAVRVDKKIEATLPKMDMSAVARSRKASHTLGIFKENEAAEDKKRMEHLRELMATAALRQSQRARRRAETEEGEESSPETPRLRQVVELAQAHKHDTSAAEVDKKYPSIAEDKLSSTEPTRTLPEKPTRPSYTPRSSYSKASQHTLLEFPEEDDDNESDHEISKALYFPHRQVTLDEQEGSEDEEPTTGKRIPIESRPRPVQDAVTSWKEDMLSQSPGEVEISITSQDKKQLFHEVGRRTTEEPGSFTLDDVSSCDSFDEYRSVIDDSSATEDWESTPMPVGRAQSQRRDRSKPPAPLGAVELEPFDHQVGGHSTVYRFSRAAVCKQLNNRENEFYETVELNHPELLDFLPRYIGVLNVTYRKAPKKKKPEQQGEDGARGIPRRDEGLAVQEPVKPAPRIVSHQQQPSNQIPQVILENNRHIIPDNLFVFPRRRGRTRSSRGSESLLPRFHQSDDDVSLEAARNMSDESSPSRPSPRQNASWGATTVNRRLQEQVLREVFSPPPVHRHPRHDRTNGKSRSFKPSQSFSVSSMSDHRGNMSSPHVHSALRHGRASTAETSPAVSLDAELPLVSRSAGERTKFAVDQSPEPHAAEDTHPSAIAIPRRRRSGGNLRRPLLSLESNRRNALEYHEDEEGYGGDGEDDVLPTEDRARPSASRGNPPSSESAGSNRTLRMGPRDDQSERPVPIPQQLGAPFSPPLNPIQSQTDLDSRVEHFILLEDLTAGMARPCVLDLKMGTRQYGVEATPQKQRSQRRKCQTTTSRELGVRVCGMQVWNNRSQSYLFEDKYFGRDLKSGREFQDALKRFFFDGHSYAAASRHIPVILERLSLLEAIIRRLPGYRFYASSLLMLYDSGAEPSEAPAVDDAQSTKSSRVSISERSQDAASVDGSLGDPHPASSRSSTRPQPTPLPAALPRPHIRLKIVDFANCVTAEDLAARPDGSVLCPPRIPGGVDRGYLRGVRSLRLYFQRIWREVNAQEWVERGEGEGMSVAERGTETAGKGWDDAADGEEGEVSV